MPQPGVGTVPRNRAGLRPFSARAATPPVSAEIVDPFLARFRFGLRLGAPLSRVLSVGLRLLRPLARVARPFERSVTLAQYVGHASDATPVRLTGEAGGTYCPPHAVPAGSHRNR